MEDPLQNPNFRTHDWGGGNDYLMCRACYFEFDYRKGPSVYPTHVCPKYKSEPVEK